MEYSCTELNDLPDEILMVIFKKLNNLDVLYSLQSVNQRLNQIIHDPIFTSHLTFVKWFSHNFVDLISCNTILDRFCLQILPSIRHKIQRLDLESSSMKYVLRAAHYPNLHTLGLYNINEESAPCLFTDEILSSGVLKNQITTLLITIYDNNNDDDDGEILLSRRKIFDYVFIVFTNLIRLTFFESTYKYRFPLFFYEPPLPTFRSSTLLKLNVRVRSFDDCLYLLDGRFNQLHTLVVDLMQLYPPDENQNQGDLPNLKCFSLSSKTEMHTYDELVLPLLYRMSNLEELGLSLVTCVTETFIDGNYLKRTIISRLSRLNYFTFHIRSMIYTDDKLNSPTTEDIQRTFIDFPNNKVIAYVDYFPGENRGRCHVYTYPSKPYLQYYVDITNSFPGGLFNYVRVVSLRDEYPFEHDFFLRIVQSFPFMEQLTVTNRKSQSRKHSYESNNDNRVLSVIEYSYLSELNLIDVHDDYIEEFLFDTKTYFQDVLLRIKHESLKRITYNFTRDSTKTNCTKINQLDLDGDGEPICSKSLQEYFPYAEIIHPYPFTV